MQTVSKNSLFPFKRTISLASYHHLSKPVLLSFWSPPDLLVSLRTLPLLEA